MHGENLIHYGVKGQRWGVRRTPVQLGHRPSNRVKKTSKKKELKRISKAAKGRNKRQKQPAANPLSEFSDDDLRRLVGRLQLEKQYRELSVSQVKKGNDFFNKKVKPAVENMVLDAAMDYANKQLRRAIGLTDADSMKKKGK